jgi:hypothetical protein
MILSTRELVYLRFGNILYHPGSYLYLFHYTERPTTTTFIKYAVKEINGIHIIIFSTEFGYAFEYGVMQELCALG